MGRLILFVTGACVLSGCSLDPKAWETAPVTVQTAQGPVVCQLYSENIQTWDRAISRPETMSVEQGDAICLAEGRRRDAAG
ncbi:hypothetical protein R5H30_18975 [Sulfitobacter sp. D35]|uniref:hypothetical protein n=1 Tax=Sulfitobacter sp. D35 TaxID=3083252 RepID=UPI00296F785D|nr:hypothetical protein [Sulfitobacter sp. D35]MDW4500078.1 hypothetical protein [Sulfitobacter sp. D35]